MQEKNSEKEYVLRKLKQRGNGYQSSADNERSAGGTSNPRPGFTYALIIGVIAGVLSVVVNLTITLSNLPTFQRAIQEGQNITYNTALAVAGLQCLNFFASLLLCLVAGYLVGRFVVQRRFGFYAGVVAGLILYLSSFVVNYIPNYPNKFTPDIVTAVVFLCIWSLIGGLMSLLGAWIATRRHPYYMRSSQ